MGSVLSEPMRAFRPAGTAGAVGVGRCCLVALGPSGEHCAGLPAVVVILGASQAALLCRTVFTPCGVVVPAAAVTGVQLCCSTLAFQASNPVTCLSEAAALKQATAFQPLTSSVIAGMPHSDVLTAKQVSMVPYLAAAQPCMAPSQPRRLQGM